jgi:competence protein ComEA
MPPRFRLLVGYALFVPLAIVFGLMILNRRPAGQSIQLQPAPTQASLRVHVAGAVLAPGVYTLPPGSIVQDALAAAGGAAAEADLGALNLARLLNDGDQVFVPALAPSPGPGTPLATGPSTARSQPAGKLNLNTATAADLETLPGIGPALAERIVAHRLEHGPFADVEDIMDVRGIGPAIYDQIKDLVTV